MSASIVWFRNDLRLHDHTPLTRAIASGQSVVPVYVFDPRQFVRLPLGFLKTGADRTQFLIEAVADLRHNLKKIGSELIVRVGKPEEILPELAKSLNATKVFTSEEATDEELRADSRTEDALKTIGVVLDFSWQATLFHLEDIPFEIDRLPDVFTEFRKKTERTTKIRSCLPAPTRLAPLPTSVEPGEMPTTEQLTGEKPTPTDPRRALVLVGGETAGLARLKAYLWEDDLLKTYKETRNGLLGADYSSKFSPWLGTGSLSPRKIYEEVKRYEQERVSNDSTYWLIFELIWRDYFRFIALKYGNKLFFQEGIRNALDTRWAENQAIFEKWKDGQTGIPFVDANMIELAQTGFMSNRGRQNVASFLTKDLKINWLWGAAWFESTLLDYDVASNYGNWQYVAGVGNDPRENRYFNILTQAQRYDPNGAYVRHWLPALATLPDGWVHRPSMLSAQEQSRFGVLVGVDTPKPLVNPGKWL